MIEQSQEPNFNEQELSTDGTNPSLQSTLGSTSKQEYKPPEGKLFEDISKNEIIDADGRLQCGSYFFELQVEKSDRDFDIPKYLMVTDDKGNKFKSPTGIFVHLEEVACIDLTGDGNQELFLRISEGGNNSFSSYVYLLENPIKEIFVGRFVGKFIDLNSDGIQEILSVYVFFSFGDLCNACSPAIQQVLCYQNGEYSDCTSQFPKYLKWQIAKGKEELINELEKYPRYPTNTREKGWSLSSLKSHSVEILANSMLLDKEEQALAYLSGVLPEIAFHWLEENKGDLNLGILSVSEIKVMEDTDQERSTEEHIGEIPESMPWLGSQKQSSSGSDSYFEIVDKLGSLGAKHGIRKLEKQ